MPVGDSIVVRFTFTGYQSVERKVVPGMALSIALKPAAKQLEQVEVRDDKNRHSSLTSVDVDKLTAAVGPSAGVESLIKTLPDVSSNNELSSQYSVRGGSFDENLVYINDVEIFRPMLVRSGQQEGVSIINPDLVSNILFSPGGYPARYGDKTSSVLDITYQPFNLNDKPLSAKVSLSLLGASATLVHNVNEKLSYAVALRHQNNSYIFRTLDTKGNYHTSYSDLQALISYSPSSKLQLSSFVLLSRNMYGLQPESQTTTFGGFYKPLVFRIYFDGQEEDRYHTVLGAFSANWQASEEWKIKTTLSAQHITESEQYDLQSQYFLYELAMGETAGDTVMFDRGVGTFLQHARNRMSTNIFALESRATRYAVLGSWDMGLRLALEQVSDHLREWLWVDSSGYALPATPYILGDSSNVPSAPILQRYLNGNSTMSTLRASAFLSREVNIHTRRESDIQILLGLRGSAYSTTLVSPASTSGTTLNVSHATFGPRINASYKPHIKQDILFRLAAGIYNQAPFYREYRLADGQLSTAPRPQNSYQVSTSADWRLRILDRPFSLTADLYYKYTTNVTPYTIDNLRITYNPLETAVAYSTGLSLRLNGQLVPGLESWASLSLMRTQEDIEGDGLPWLDRPTDQRLSFKLFLSDNIPSLPWWQMSLQLIFATGTPVTVPMLQRSTQTYRLPEYYRVDWGNTVQLLRFPSIAKLPVFRHLSDLQVGIEVFNLFNFRNTVSFLWVSDYENYYYPVPNYLTARQINLKVTAIF